MRNIDPVTPGELLKEEFLEPMGISQYRLAKEIGVPAQRIGQIIAGKRSITADTDLRLCRFFSLSNGYWLRAQAAYDTEIAEEVLKGQLKIFVHGTLCQKLGTGHNQRMQSDRLYAALRLETGALAGR